MGKKRGIENEVRDIRTFALPSVAPLMLNIVSLFSGKGRFKGIQSASKELADFQDSLDDLKFLNHTALIRDSKGVLIPSANIQLILTDSPKLYAEGTLDQNIISQESLPIAVHRTFGAEGLRHFLALVVMLEENYRTGYFHWNVNNILKEMGYERDPGGSFNIDLKRKATEILLLLTNLTIVASRKDARREEVRLQKLFHIDSQHLVKYANGVINNTIAIQSSSYWYQDAFFQDAKNRKGRQYTKLLRKIITENHWKHSLTIYLSTLLSIFWRISRGKPRSFSVKNLVEWCNLELAGSNRTYYWNRLVQELNYMKANEYLGDYKIRSTRSKSRISDNDTVEFYPPAWLTEEFDLIRKKRDEIIGAILPPPELVISNEEFSQIAQKLCLSNRELAQRLQISHTMVNWIQAGKRRVSDKLARKLQSMLREVRLSED